VEIDSIEVFVLLGIPFVGLFGGQFPQIAQDVEKK
jgi:hypothetical protein